MKNKSFNLFERREVVFSPCDKYRYRLRQIWGDGPLQCYLMLNPSTADLNANDPTVERVERRARASGFAGLEVINLFAYRATDPQDMLAQQEPVGPDNDQHIIEAAKSCGQLVLGWGNHGQHMNRGRNVIEMLLQHDIQLFCLKVNNDGYPAHPLYIGYEATPKPYFPPFGTRYVYE